MNPRAIVIGSWAGAAGIITIQWVTSGQSGFPPPGRYLASGVVFSMLYLLVGPAPTLGAALAGGTAFALLMRPYVDKKGNDFKTSQQATSNAAGSVLQTSATWLSKLAGQSGSA